MQIEFKEGKEIAPENIALVLRTCNADMTSYNDFVWPRSGYAEAPDWKSEPCCGYGLHGLLEGKGDYGLMSSQWDAVWMVVAVDKSLIVPIDSNKVKFPWGYVVYSGTSREALKMILNSVMKEPSTTGYAAHASTTGYAAHASTTGDDAHASTTGRYAHASTTGRYAHASTTGRYAHASTTGDAAHASTTGYAAHASTTGDDAHASTTGRYAHASTTGRYAHASTTGRYAHASTTGDAAHASTTGYAAHASTTGDDAHASTTGRYAHASTTGDDGIACSLGFNGWVKASTGPLVAVWHDGERRRVSVAYVGEDGIKPDTWYRLDEKGAFIEVD